MELFIDIVGFFGSWLLVAGPTFQASLELRDQDIEFDRIHEVKKSIAPPRKVSPWWWLLPPVRIYLAHRSGEEFNRRYVEALNDEDVEALFDFRSKALGWLLVASGGLLIAAKETYEVWLHLEWPVYVFWIALVIMTYICISFTVVSSVRRREFSTEHGTSKSK